MNVLYMTERCPWCHKAADWFEENNISIEKKFVDSDSEAQKEFLSLNVGVGVPVVTINDTPMVGYDPSSWKSALGL